MGEYTSLALDASGRPHISYCQLQPNPVRCTALKYARYDGAAWITETVENGEEVGERTSLALDVASRPHIAYYGGGLKYAYYNGTSWITETVDSGGGFPSLALDAGGRPHIAYSSSAGLRHAYHDGTAWHIESIDSYCDYHFPCSFPSLVLDAAGRPRVAYESGAPTSYLKYAYQDGAAWQSETVAFTGWAGPTSLALDAAGRPHIAYTEGYKVQCCWQRYAYHDGQTWHTEVVEDDSGGGALVLDTAGRPHIAYNGAGLRYAYFDGTAWISETVDTTNPVAYISLVMDATGRAHVSYFAWNSGDLRYAYQCTPVGGTAAVGPSRLPLGATGLYSATYYPLTASLPVTFTWNDGAGGPAAAYSWTLTGTHTVAVTATNPCGQVTDTLTVTVFCQPVDAVLVEGPLALVVAQQGTYRATPEPLTASLPLTFTWDNGAMGPKVGYSWTVTGTYTLTVTATNVCGDARAATRSVRVLAAWPYHRYLPLYFQAAARRER